MLDTIAIREAAPSDVEDALRVCETVFMAFEAPIYSESAVSKFIDGCVHNQDYIANYTTLKHKMFIACAGDKIVGVINERGNGRISMVFVDQGFQRMGIATALMDKMIHYFSTRGTTVATLESSPYAHTFYLEYGFVDQGGEQCIDGFIFTPMTYAIKGL